MRGVLVKLPVTTTEEPGIFMLEWNTSQEDAETASRRFEANCAGGGLTMHVDPMLDAGKGGGVIYVMASTTKSRWVPWNLLAGTLHSIAAHFMEPEEMFAIELEKPRRGPRAHTGLFLLQSPGREIWKVLVWSLRTAWKHGALRKMRIHPLVHHMPDWSPQRWRDLLGEARLIFGGLHWCYGPNRFDPDIRPRDNYFHKVYTMLNLARRQGYEHLVSFDDDVMLPPSALAFMIDIGPKAYYSQGCGVVAPLLQNGVPSVELWAESFLDMETRDLLYACFETAGLQWEHYPFTSEELGPPLVPWDANEWYSRVHKAKDIADFKGVHPVRGNRTCMARALGITLPVLEEFWGRWRNDHGFIVDQHRRFPYLCNNAYLIRTDLYAQVLERSDLYRNGGADEVPLNLLLKEKKLPMCFVGNSFGIHPAYNHHPLREDMEQFVLAKVLKLCVD
jgi:hypothetical protein